MLVMMVVVTARVGRHMVLLPEEQALLERVNMALKRNVAGDDSRNPIWQPTVRLGTGEEDKLLNP